VLGQQNSSAVNSSASGAQRNPKGKVLHIIGYSHIDAAWLWPWRDGANIVLTTFRSALDRMKETPDFRYSHSSAIHYSWVERADPKMFDEVRARIREGRWEVVGGWPVEPDCNIPSTESFVRHSLYGKTISSVPSALMFRLALTRIRLDMEPVFRRFSNARAIATTFSCARRRMRRNSRCFWWEAPDGSRVLTLRIRRGYSQNAERIADGAQNNFQPGFDHAAYFLGVGDHGGAVTKAQIKRVIEQQQDASLPELRWSTVGEFSRQLRSLPR
jgi:alpha-mannosidase